MHIGILCEYFYPDDMGSTGTIVSDLARYLQDNFPDVKVSAITSGHLYRSSGNMAPLALREDWKGIDIQRLRVPRTKQKSSLVRLAAGLWFTFRVGIRLIRSERCDVILVLTNPPMLPLAAQLAKRLRGTPYVFLIHDLYADMSVALGLASPNSRSVRLSQKLQAKFLSGAGRVVALGRCMKEHLDEKFQLPREKVAVISNWGTLAQTKTKSESNFSKQHDLQGFVVLYAGNFGRFHNFDNILDAAALLKDKRPDIQFVLVGDGAKKEAIEQRVQNDRLSNVRVLPFVPKAELSDMLSAADVSLITLERHTEGLAVPCKFYNILASGRASIAIMDGKAETARSIVEQDSGLCVPQDDSAALCSALESLADHPEKVAQMGLNARRAFESHYTLPIVASQFHDLLLEVSQQRKTQSHNVASTQKTLST